MVLFHKENEGETISFNDCPEFQQKSKIISPLFKIWIHKHCIHQASHTAHIQFLFFNKKIVKKANAALLNADTENEVTFVLKALQTDGLTVNLIKGES